MIESKKIATKDRTPIKLKKIRDRTANSQGFGRFLKSSIGPDGDAVSFEYPSRARYAVPLDYLLSWYDEPHHKRSNRRLDDQERESRVLRSRTMSDGHLARIYLADGSQYDVAWDVVLMACEPAYEHYGGLTAHAKKLTKRWAKERGPFRVK